MGLFNDKRGKIETSIRFREPFVEKYTLTTKHDIQNGFFPIKTTTEIRWVLEVAKIYEDGDAELSLFTLENLLVETNNPNLDDIAALNKAFGKMYSELHLLVNFEGKVKKVLNIKKIQEKWQRTKSEMEKIREQVPALETLLQLNDEIFSTPEKIKMAVESNEFFNTYRYLVFGKDHEVREAYFPLTNVLQTNEMNWNYRIASARTELPFSMMKRKRFKFEGTSNFGDSKSWRKKAYEHIPTVEDVGKVKPKFNENGGLLFEAQTGRLLHLQTSREEVVIPDLVYGKIEVELLSDTYAKEIEDKEKKGENGTTSY